MIDLTYFCADGKINRIKKRNESFSRFNLHIHDYVKDIALNTPIESMATFVKLKSQSISPKLLFSGDEHPNIIDFVATKKETIFWVVIYENHDDIRVKKIDLLNHKNKNITIYMNSNNYNNYFYCIYNNGTKILLCPEEEPLKIITKDLIPLNDKVYLLGSHSHPIQYMSVASTSDYFASCSEDNILKLWDLNNEKCIKTVDFPRIFNDIELINQFYMAGNDDDDDFWIFNLEKNEFLIEEENYRYSSIKESNNFAFIIKEDGFVDCLSLVNGNFLWSTLINKRGIDDVEINEEKQLLFVSDIDGNIHVLSAADGKLLETMFGHSGGVWNILSTSSNLITSGFDETIRIWDLNTRECKAILVGHKHRILGMVLSSHKDYLISWDRLGCTIAWKANWNDSFQF